MNGLIADVLRDCVARWLSPLDVSRLRAVNRWFRVVVADTAGISRGESKHEIMRAAARQGHKDVVELMIGTDGNRATDWNWGLCGAARGGHREMVELMITKGATDWNWGLYWAARGGHREIVELMITKGATDWNGGCTRQ